MPIAVKLNGLRRRQHATIPVPISPKARVASIGKNRITLGDLHRFSMERWPDMEAFRPHVLIGSTADLRCLASLADAGTLDISSVDTAVFVATGLPTQAIGDVERVVLWQAFGVPVYEMLLSSDGQLIACECEAHEGWHLEARMTRQRLPNGTRIETALCACGRKEPRIVAAENSHLTGALAATA